MTLSRRSLFISGAATAAAATLAPVMLRAQDAPAAPRAVSYTRRIGDIEVTTLLDGYFLLDQAWITALDPALVTAGLTAAALDTAAPVPLAITGYLIRQGDALTLLDAGAGSTLGAGAGNLGATLQTLGVAPEAITKVLVSHLHPDHIGGLTRDGVALFPNASLHVSETDRAFWSDAANAAKVPEAIRPWFDIATGVLSAYGERVTPFDGEADLGGGIFSLPLPGHTPGHTGYRLSSGDAQALFWADTAFLASLQFAHPEAGIVLDIDGAQATETRRRVLDMAVADNLLISGTHLPFPGFGHVAQKDEAFAWVPEEWKLL